MGIQEKELQLVFKRKLDELVLDNILMEDLDRVYLPMAKLIYTALSTREQTRIIGINGAQGAGKTTFSELLQLVLEHQYGMRVVRFSIDDFYLSHEARQTLAQEVHPLLATRGVPGTHDMKLCEEVINQLSSANSKTVTKIPRFNKATDEPFPQDQWDEFNGRPDVILFDGWIVGAVEQKETELITPINDLEKQSDPYCVWRRYVNAQLKDNYCPVFDKIDLLVMIKIPSFDKVYEWRTLQEHKLKDKVADEENDRVMSDEEVRHFIAYYERLTRHILNEMPDRADMVFNVSNDHRICL